VQFQLASNLTENYFYNININGHLNAMLLWTHASAAAINAKKEIINERQRKIIFQQ
jgi:hypothetical protein